MTLPQPKRLEIDEILLMVGQTWPERDGWKAKCPAHEDTSPSLRITQGQQGRTLLNCRAGCSFHAICAALGIEPRQIGPAPTERNEKSKITAIYDYKTTDGELVYQVVRFQGLTTKDFKQRKPDGRGGYTWKLEGVTRIPYRLPDLVGHQAIYIVEGEKDVETMWARGLPATCNSGGAGKWRDSETQAIKNIGVKRVVILPDNDGPGRKHADDIARLMKANNIAFAIVELPGVSNHGDVSDWFANGHQVAELEELATKPYVVQSEAVPAPVGEPNDELTELQRKTSVGQAERFAAVCAGEFRYNHFRRLWLHYESPRWRPDASKAVYRSILELVRAQQREALDIRDSSDRKREIRFAMELESVKSINQIIDSATWNPHLADTGENWDADPWMLAVNNGVVNLKTGELNPGDPANRLTLKCSVPYDRTAECPRWWRFLSEIFGADEALVEFVWRLCGYILTGQTTERVVPMFYGRGANGKSVFLNVLSTVLGDYATTLPFSSLQFQKQPGIPNDLAALVGRRLVTMIEASEGLRLDEAKLKTLSGNDRISARFLHGEFFTFQPVAKFVLAMNHKPIAKDDSPGFWDRIRLVPFTHTFPEGARDESLQATLINTEGPGILAWAIEGCLRWQQSGLTKPASVIEATAEYQADSDQLAEFLSTCCSTENRDALTGAGALQKAYNSWADHRGLGKHERLSGTALGRLLSERFHKKRGSKGLYYIGIEVFSGQLWD
jgi:putative DNA primase/helicase